MNFEDNILGRSLIYNTNKIGPKTDPCGTPDFFQEFSTRVIIVTQLIFLCNPK